MADNDLDAAFQATENQYDEAHAWNELADAGVVIREWGEFMADEPPAFDWILPGMIAKGFKGDLNAKSKQWKSFFAMQLALCVSTGRQFLNWPASPPRPTVYFNLELMERGAWERGSAMQTALDATPAEGFLFIVNCRASCGQLRGMAEQLVAELRRLGIDLVVLDPRYKLIRDGEDENSQAGLRPVLQFRDALAKVAAVLMVGHDPKGDVSGKSVTDRGAGSYTAGADYDFAFALSPHEQDGYSVLSTSCRYRAAPVDLSICFDPERQVFDADAETPATVKQTKRGGTGANADPTDKAKRNRLKLEALERAVKTYAATHGPTSMGTFRQDMAETTEGAAFSRDALRAALDSFIERKILAKTTQKVRTDSGGVKNVKNGGFLVGTPEKIAAYEAQFDELPLNEAPQHR
jgi:hypothetical protein